MTGSEFKRIRTISGFTAKEFAEHINMSTSYVYSLEQKYNRDISPRREEEFIEFLGQSVYQKSRRIYELEIQAKEKHLRELEERNRQRVREEEEEEERQRILRQQQLQQKKLQRDAELEEQIRLMEMKNSGDTAHTSGSYGETVSTDAAGANSTGDTTGTPGA